MARQSGGVVGGGGVQVGQFGMGGGVAQGLGG